MSSIDGSFRGLPQTVNFYGEGQSKSFSPDSAVFGVAAHEAQNHRYFEGIAAAAGGYVMGSTTTFDVRWDPVARREVPVDINRVHDGEIRLVGNFSYHPQYLQQALQLLASGAIPCDKLITRYELENTEQGLIDIRDGNVLKAVVTPNKGELV